MKALSYQPDWIWNKLEGNSLGSLLRDVLDEITWKEKNNIKFEWNLLMAAQIKDMRAGKLSFCLLDLFLMGSYSILLLL